MKDYPFRSGSEPPPLELLPPPWEPFLQNGEKRREFQREKDLKYFWIVGYEI